MPQEMLLTLGDVVLVIVAIAVGVLVVRTFNAKGSTDGISQDDLVCAEQALEAINVQLAQLAQQAATANAVNQQRFDDMTRHVGTVTNKNDELRREVTQLLTQNRDTLDKRLSDVVSSVTNKNDELRHEVTQSLTQTRATLDQRLDKTTNDLNKSLEDVRTMVDKQLTDIRSDTNTQLDRMRATVDEKLQKTLNERITQSFALVNERLQQVDQGLGEMKSLASDVGGLKKVLSNVKTRGIVGEIQLGAILEEILSPGQYEENVATVPGSSERVEFAIKLPGEDNETVYLPVDSKFPGDTYEHLRDAQDAGDSDAVEAAWKALEMRIRAEAKDIHDKYIAPPATTNFGILFLPFEGLYAEVANRRGLIERLQREYRVNIAGPSTMAALLNSLEMGFQTVAIQKRANEIQQVLAAVKTEFGTYQTMLQKAQKQLGTASKTIDSLVGTRSRAMERKLRSITSLDSLEEADAILGIEAPINTDLSNEE